MNYRTAGESHGHGILGLLEGFPSGLQVDVAAIDAELRRRQTACGRGDRKKIEFDKVEFLSGLWQGKTIGSPIALWIKNKDFRIDTAPELFTPRPGHADLAGSIKYGLPIRPILERASARETAGRVAAGALTKQLLAQWGITVVGFVRTIAYSEIVPKNLDDLGPTELLELRGRCRMMSVCPDDDSFFEMLVSVAEDDGDTVGGVVEVRAFGLPIGLGSHVQWDERLDGKLAQAVMSIQAVKGVQIGEAFGNEVQAGAAYHDILVYDPDQAQSRTQGFVRTTNNAGGIEGGMTNGQPLSLRAYVKPIPTLKKGFPTIDLRTKEPMLTVYERSDVCAVAASSVIVENIVALELAKAMLVKYGGDSVDEIAHRIPFSPAKG